jgi:hypothetical protein
LTHHRNACAACPLTRTKQQQKRRETKSDATGVNNISGGPLEDAKKKTGKTMQELTDESGKSSTRRSKTAGTRTLRSGRIRSCRKA